MQTSLVTRSIEESHNLPAVAFSFYIIMAH